MNCPKCNEEDWEISELDINIGGDYVQFDLSCNSCGSKFVSESELKINIIEEL